MSTAATEKKPCPVQNFVVEMDHPHNADMLIQCIPGTPKLRSRITAARPVKDKRSGEMVIPEDRTRHLGKYPEIPGMQLTLMVAARKYKITDPLCDNPDLLDRIKRQMNRDRVFRVETLKGVPDQEGTLDPHYMKTLVREVYNMLKIGHARVVKGVAPTLEDIQKLEGRFLTNPANRVPTTMPRYEDEMDEWLNNLSRTGG